LSPLGGVRLLLVLPQLPQDPASGAARSTRTMCEMLAAAGMIVRAVATTASERVGPFDCASYLRELGISPQVHPGRTEGRLRPEIEFDSRGVHFRLLDTGPRSAYRWQQVLTRQFDRIFDDELYTFKPDLLLVFGGLPQDVRRYERARRQGVKIVFALRNESYLGSLEMLSQTDAILTPSQFLSDYYKAGAGIDSVPLPLPIDMEDVIAETYEPIFFTMINPSPEKGLMVLARLAEELGVRRPDIPLLVIESRGSAGKLVQAGLSAGFDLRRHESLMTSPPMAQPKEIFAATRALLVPSLWQEAAGRVAAEALLNGVPPLVSDRGGLPETCNNAGFYLPIPPDITPSTPRPVPPSVVEPWLDLICRLEDDQIFWSVESLRAREAGNIYRMENLAPRYVDYFSGILNRS
jgi:glycosyltransferase involved in cell wall biosynthesis